MSFAKYLQQFSSRSLEPVGFVAMSRGGKVFVRKSTDIDHGVEIVTHKDVFTAGAFWRLKVGPIPDTRAFNFYKRFRELDPSVPKWFERSDAAAGFSRLSQAFADSVLPFLNNFSSVQVVVHAVDEGALTRPQAFGADKLWGLFYEGFARLAVDGEPAAMPTFQEYLQLDDQLGSSLDWERARRQAVVEAMRGATQS